MRHANFRQNRLETMEHFVVNDYERVLKSFSMFLMTFLKTWISASAEKEKKSHGLQEPNFSCGPTKSAQEVQIWCLVCIKLLIFEVISLCFALSKNPLYNFFGLFFSIL